MVLVWHVLIFIFWRGVCFVFEREKKENIKMGKEKGKEDLGGVGGRKNMIKTYGMKKILI